MIDYMNCNNCLKYDSYFNQENSASNGIENVIIIIKKNILKKRKKRKEFKYVQQPTVIVRLSSSSISCSQREIPRRFSMPEINGYTKLLQSRTISSHATINHQQPFKSKFIVNKVSEHHFDELLNPFYYPTQTKFKVYRCQSNAPEETCCCSCNSDAMFEVMKSLYDCYKKKNCDNCNCILCGHLQKEERLQGEIRKSLEAAGLDTASFKDRKEKIRKAEKLLEGKTPEQNEKLLREMGKTRQPLPEGKTASEKELIKKVRNDLGLPPEPKSAEEKANMRKAEASGIITPLEGKTPAQKEKILRAQADLGISLPEGRTASEKALCGGRVPTGIPSEKLRKTRAAGLITPLEGKTPEQKEKILKGLAMNSIPLPEGKTPSEKKLIDKVRAELGLSPEPKTKALRDRYAHAANAGFMQPLEGKSPKEKEKILQGLADVGLPLPEGRTPSEKLLVAKVKARAGPPLDVVAPSEKMQRAKAAGFLTPLAGKSPDQREKILRGLAMQGIPLPEGRTPSEKKLIDKVRMDLGLPPEPKSKSVRDKHGQAANVGVLVPLEGKTPQQKEKILRGLHDMGIPLPVGRTPSEKALIAKIMASPRALSEVLPSTEKMRKAKAAGLLTPIAGKTPEQREKILRGLAMQGIALPEGKTPSEKKLIDKVRMDLGLPPEPKSKSIRDKHGQAANAGVLMPLEGKTPPQKEKILRDLHDMGIPLPVGRTPSEKALIAKIMAGPRAPSEVLQVSEKMRKAKAAGLLTPLAGKTPDQREKILRGLAMQGIPLPEGRTPSEKKLIDKVRMDLALPPEPKSKSIRDKHGQAANVRVLLPLEGKTLPQKEKILRGLHDMGIPLPVGRTPSEKALIAKIMAGPRAPSEVLPLSEKMRRAKAAGLLSPLAGKTPDQREKILRALAMQGIPLPEGQAPSEKKLIDKVRMDLGLPPEPKLKSIRDKHGQAANVGVLLPLEDKTPPQKEKILRGLHDMGIPLPVGRTPSEKALIAKIMAGPRAPSEVLALSEKMRRAKAAGLLSPLAGKTPDQREKILRALAMQGIPLPEGQTPTEKKLIDKVRMDLALPPEPKTKSIRDKHGQAANVGVLLPLEGKTMPQKEKILQGLYDMCIPLPVGRTPSEKALIAKIMVGPRALSAVLAPSDKLRKAKAKGLLTPLKCKTPAQKEKILKGLANYGIPFPEGQTPSERNIIDKVRTDIGLPPEPKTPEMREKYAKAADTGILQPLEGKPPKEKERILQGLHDMGIPLPEGRTSSEKSLIAKVKARPRVALPSEKLRKAKADGLLTPLKGKTPEQKEKILRNLVKQGIPLPEGQTPSDKKLIAKIRANVGLPPEPKTPTIKEKYAKARAAGLITPLEGKTLAQKEKILRGQAAMGVPLSEGRTPSEKSLIAKIKTEPTPSITTDKYRKAKAAGLLSPLADKTPEQREKILKGLAKAGLPLPHAKTSSEKALINQVKKEFGIPDRTPSEKLRKAKAAGLLTPLEGKAPAQREKILRGRAAAGLPLPEGRSPSERALIQKIKDDTGFVTPSPSERLRKAKAAGLLTPLKGKSLPVKEKILRDMLAAGVPIPEGATPSEKALISKLAAGPPPKKSRSERLKQAKAAGLLTPLKGKTPDQKQKILRGLVDAGLPLPEPRTESEKDLIDKIRKEAGLPPEPKTPSLKEKYKKAQAAGLVTPLEGKTPAEKGKILKRLHDAGIPLPEGRTASEKTMVKKVKGTAPERRTPSEKLKAAKAAGLLTPLSGKTPVQKEKILRGLAKTGVLLPEGKTPSDKDLINKIRNELGLPPEPKTPFLREKMQKAQAAGIITPLEGKTSAQKLNILKALAEAGLPLPEGRTPSEKSLIAKIKAESKARKSPSEKLRKAKAAGLLTPLEGKSPSEKERIMKGLAEHGLPLPEAKTSSVKKLAAKTRKELGLPPAPKTPSMKERYEKAAAAGVLVPLEGLTPSEREKVLKAQADFGLPLPEGRTSSEKSIIAKLKLARGPSKISSEKMRKAKTAGLLTPLEGKTQAEKEKIIRGLAEAGLPLPEGKTSSDKSLIHKVRTDLGIPPTAKTASEKSVIRKAKADGLFTPITDKPPAEKERILKGLAEAGLPLPVGQTLSDKELIKKIRAEAGLAAEPTASEKMGKIKKTSKKVGVTPSKRIGAGIGAAEFEDIIKTTTCDRGCGCDKKKIRFKHSYVKIRVTSPDISSLCSCPGECIPGVKNGAFIDNEGIKVTVGRVIGIPSYPIVTPCSGHSNTYKDFLPNRLNSTPKMSMYKMRDRETYYSNSNENYTVNTSSSGVSDSSTRPYDTESDNNYLQRSTPPYEGRASNSVRIVESSRDFESLDNIYKDPTLDCKSIHSSFDSILVIKSETSLSLTTSASSSSDTISVMSDVDSTVSSYSTNDCQLSGEILSSHSIDRCAGTIESQRDDPINKSTWTYLDACKKRRNIAPMCTNVRQTEYMTFRMAETKQCSPYNNKNCELLKKSDPVVVLSQVTKKLDLAKMVDKILAKKQFSDASSIFIVVPTSDNEAENSSNASLNSINNSIKSLENFNDDNPISAKPGLSSSVKRVKCGRGKKFYMQEISMLSIRDKETETVFNNEPLKVFTQKEMKHKICQITTPNNMVKTLAPNCHAISTDTTVDRPCCCRLKESVSAITIRNSSSKEQYVANVVSRQINPLFLKQGKGDCDICTNQNYLEELNTPVKRKTKCPCEEHYSVSDKEGGPKPGTRSMGIVTELKAPQILADQAAQKKLPCDKLAPALAAPAAPGSSGSRKQIPLEKPTGSSNSSTKKTRFGDIHAKKSSNTKNDTNEAGPVCLKFRLTHSITKLLSRLSLRTLAEQLKTKCSESENSKELLAKGNTVGHTDCNKPKSKENITNQNTTDSLPINLTTSKELIKQGTDEPTQKVIGENQEVQKKASKTKTGICKCYEHRAETSTRSTSDEKFPPVIQGVDPGDQPSVKPGDPPGVQPGDMSGVPLGIPPGVQPCVTPGVPPNLQAIPETCGKNSCGWIDTGALMKMRSEMSLLTSGFKLSQKKKPQGNINAAEPEIELDFEDAIRYFATMNPEKIREIINLKHEHKALQAGDEDRPNDEEVKQSDKKSILNLRKNKKCKDKEKEKKKGKGSTEASDYTDDTEKNLNNQDFTEDNKEKLISQDLTKHNKNNLITQESTEHIKKKKNCQDWMEHSKKNLNSQDQVKPPCECPYGPIVPPIVYDTTETESGEMEPCQGFKFSVCAKGADSPGLTRIICFDMVRESYTSW